MEISKDLMLTCSITLAVLIIAVITLTLLYTTAKAKLKSQQLQLDRITLSESGRVNAAIAVQRRSVDLATYNENLIKLFGSMFNESAEMATLNNKFAKAGSLIEAEYEPGGEEAALQALATVDVIRSYVEFSDHGSARICLVPYSALINWIDELKVANSKHISRFNNELTEITQIFAKVLEQYEQPN